MGLCNLLSPAYVDDGHPVQRFQVIRNMDSVFCECSAHRGEGVREGLRWWRCKLEGVRVKGKGDGERVRLRPGNQDVLKPNPCEVSLEAILSFSSTYTPT